MIRKQIFGFIALVLLVAAVGFVFERILFLSSAQRTNGTVTQLTAQNSTCGSSAGRRRYRSRYPCTTFSATVKFIATDGGQRTLWFSAGSSRGHNQPISEARFKQGGPVPIVYDPKSPSKAYEDSLWGVWGVPIMLFIFQLGAMIGMTAEPKNRREHYR